MLKSLACFTLHNVEYIQLSQSCTQGGGGARWLETRLYKGHDLGILLSCYLASYENPGVPDSLIRDQVRRGNSHHLMNSWAIPRRSA